MQNHIKLWIRPMVLVSLLSTTSISSAMADDLKSAASLMFEKLKLNSQAPQPPEFMPPPTGNILPANTSPQTSFAVPPEFMPAAIKASDPSAVTIPAVSQGGPDAQDLAVNPNDGSVPLPALDDPNNPQQGPDVFEATGDAGADSGNFAPLT